MAISPLVGTNLEGVKLETSGLSKTHNHPPVGPSKELTNLLSQVVVVVVVGAAGAASVTSRSSLEACLIRPNGCSVQRSNSKDKME